jgi:hypothetical protein
VTTIVTESINRILVTKFWRQSMWEYPTSLLLQMKRYVAKGNETGTHLKGVPCSVCTGRFNRARCVPGSLCCLQTEHLPVTRPPHAAVRSEPCAPYPVSSIRPLETLILVLPAQITKLVDNQRIKMPSLCLQCFKNLIPKLQQRVPGWTSEPYSDPG